MELKPEWRDRKKCLKRKFSKINENQQTTYPRIPENLNWYLFKKKKKKEKQATKKKAQHSHTAKKKNIEDRWIKKKHYI